MGQWQVLGPGADRQPAPAASLPQDYFKRRESHGYQLRYLVSYPPHSRSRACLSDQECHSVIVRQSVQRLPDPGLRQPLDGAANHIQRLPVRRHDQRQQCPDHCADGRHRRLRGTGGKIRRRPRIRPRHLQQADKARQRADRLLAGRPCHLFLRLRQQPDPGTHLPSRVRQAEGLPRQARIHSGLHLLSRLYPDPHHRLGRVCHEHHRHTV